MSRKVNANQSYFLRTDTDANRVADNSVAIWDRESGATVDHGVPAEVRVKHCRRAIAWNSTDANTLGFVTASEKELRFWSVFEAG